MKKGRSAEAFALLVIAGLSTVVIAQQPAGAPAVPVQPVIPAVWVAVRPIEPPATPLASEAASAGVTRFSFIAYGDTRSSGVLGVPGDGEVIHPEHTRIVGHDRPLVDVTRRGQRTERRRARVDADDVGAQVGEQARTTPRRRVDGVDDAESVERRVPTHRRNVSHVGTVCQSRCRLSGTLLSRPEGVSLRRPSWRAS